MSSRRSQRKATHTKSSSLERPNEHCSSDSSAAQSPAGSGRKHERRCSSSANRTVLRGASLLEGGLVVVVGPSNLLDECPIVGGVLEGLSKRGHEDVCSAFPENGGQCVGPVDEPVGGPKLHPLLIGTRDVYDVSQFRSHSRDSESLAQYTTNAR